MQVDRISVQDGMELPINNDGRISASAQYEKLAVARLCGNGGAGCELRLLCTRCGINQTMVMNSVSRGTGGGNDDREMQELLQFETIVGNKKKIMMPPIIVIDAASILRASQREAVIPGAGLDGAIRPIQGPVCSECCAKSTAKHQRYMADDEGDLADATSSTTLSSLPSSPRVVDFHTTMDFTNRHHDIVKSIESLKISSMENDMTAGDFVMDEVCECGHSTNFKCGNVRQTTWKKSTEVSTDPHFSLIFGQLEDVDNKFEKKVYEICIVDTRHQQMCHIYDHRVHTGLSGQFQYFNSIHSCEIPAVVVTATLVPTITESAKDISVTSVSTIPTSSVVMATCTPHDATTPRVLTPQSNASCFVCCSLLDEQDGSTHIDPHFHLSNYNRPRHTNVYLKAHNNWAHKECTVACEKQRVGVCMKVCPRLNTLVSTEFDGTPRFENVCTPCMSIADNDPVAAFSSIFKSPCFSSSTSNFKSSSKHDIRQSSSVTHRVTSTPPKKPSGANWLSAAGSLRKKAAINLAKNKMTKSQRKESDAYVFPVDKSGVYNDKINGTWYTMDQTGEIRSPVCDLPFWDTYFNEKRTWSTLGERTEAITSHECLLETGDM